MRRPSDQCHRADGEDFMKLLNSWKRTLSLGLLAATGVHSASAQEISVPVNSPRDGKGVQPASYLAGTGSMGRASNDVVLASCEEMGGCQDGYCDSGCGDLGCTDGSCDRGLFGRGLGQGGGMMGGGPFGGGPLGSGMMDGCGPFGGGMMGGGPTCEDFAQMGGQDLACRHCGYRGCLRCGWGVGLLAGNKLRGLVGSLRPYGEGGLASQRWYDIAVEGTAFRRDKGAGLTNFSSQGPGTNNIVLGSNAVDLDQWRAGLGVSAALQTGVGSSLEAVYFGLNDWERNSTVFSTPANSPTLFSFLSNFGTSPLGGFDDPDRSFQHSLNYQSAFHNGEVNFRRRWVGAYQWFQGSWLAGIRYFDLDESLRFSARGENNDTFQSNGLRFFDYTTQVRNQLVGFQVGGDLWVNIIPGIRSGVELKTGVFGNHAEQGTTINANSINNMQETISDGRTAFLAQLSATTVYRLSYSWALRGSYQWLYVDNVALAPDNINPTPPAIILPNSARNVSINTDGEIMYNGFTIGAEYLW